MIENLLELLTTITPEFTSTCLNKSRELGFDVDGDVSPEESFISLGTSTNLLRDLIEKKKLKLPRNIQHRLIDALQKIVTVLDYIVSGNNDLANLIDAIEQLNEQIWIYGLHNLSDEVINYQTKLNQIEELILENCKLKKELQMVLKSKRQ